MPPSSNLGAIGAGPLGDTTTAAVQQALKGLAGRQRATAANVANLQTPGYLAARVSFEGSLASALGQGDLSATQMATARSTSPTRADGNNVDLDDEVLIATKTGLSYQTMVQAMDAKLRLLRTAAEAR